MQQPTNPRRNNRTFRQQRNGKDMEIERLHRDVRELSELLDRERQHCCKERNERLLINQALEETKQDLAKQKALKEMYINKGKETKRELERLEKYCKEDTLSAFKIAQKVNDTNRQKKKKDLHADYEELKVAHLVGTEKYIADLQVKEETNKTLQAEVDNLRVSQHELKLKYEADLLTVNQLVETLRREKELQSQAHAERVSQEQQLTWTLRVEQEALCQKATEEIAALQYAAFEREKKFQTELEDLRSQLSNQKAIEEEYEKLRVAYKTSQDRSTAEVQQEKGKALLLQQEQEKSQQAQKLQQELEKENKSFYNTIGENQVVIWNLNAEKGALQQKMEQEISRLQQMIMEKSQQAQKLQQELEMENKSLYSTIAETQVVIWNLNAEKGALQQKMEQEIGGLQQMIMEKESIHHQEVEGLKSQITLLISQNMELSSDLAQREECMPPRRKRASREETRDELSCMELTIPNAAVETPGTVGPAEAVQTGSPVGAGAAQTSQLEPAEEGAAASEAPEVPNQMSRVKQVRHFFGLRKPESWKKKKDASSFHPPSST